MAQRSQAARRAATRGAILNAAAARFRAQGVATTTVDQIVEDAGVTKGALYHYFESKDDLVAGVIEAMETFDAGEGGPLPSTAATLGRQAAARPLPAADRKLNHELYALAEENERIRDAFGTRIRAALHELADRHQVPLAHVIIAGALYDGLWNQRLVNPDLVTDDLFEQAFALLAHLPRSGRAGEGSAGTAGAAPT